MSSLRRVPSSALLRSRPPRTAQPRKHRGEIRSAAILYMIFKNACRHLVGVRIEPIDPALDLLQIAALSRDHENGVHPLKRDDPHQPGNQAAPADDRVQIGGDVLCLSHLKGIEGEGHLPQPIDIELPNPPGERVEPGPGNDQHIARGVDPNNGATGEKWLDHGADFARVNVTKRESPNAVAGPGSPGRQCSISPRRRPALRERHRCFLPVPVRLFPRCR